MVSRITGPGAALVGAVLGLVHLAPGYLVGRLLGGSVGGLPQLSTTPQTITAYTSLLDAVGVAVGIGGVFVLGYWAGTRFDQPTAYRRFAALVGIAGSVGYLATMGIVLIFVVREPLVADHVGLTIANVLGTTLRVGVQFAIVGFAGAAFAYFDGERSRVGTIQGRDDSADPVD